MYANAFIQPHNSLLREKYYLYVEYAILLTVLNIFLGDDENNVFFFGSKLKSF